MIKPRVLLLVIGAVLVSALCARLGVWQLGRWQAKHAARMRLERALATPPLECGGTPPAREQALGLRISLAGRFDQARQFLLRGREREGEQGVEVVTPLIT